MEKKIENGCFMFYSYIMYFVILYNIYLFKYPSSNYLLIVYNTLLMLKIIVKHIFAIIKINTLKVFFKGFYSFKKYIYYFFIWF